MEGYKMDSKVLENVTALEGFNQSMKCAIDKAKNGSIAEDSYFIEKLEKTANRMGFVLLPMNN